MFHGDTEAKSENFTKTLKMNSQSAITLKRSHQLANFSVGGLIFYIFVRLHKLEGVMLSTELTFLNYLSETALCFMSRRADTLSLDDVTL